MKKHKPIYLYSTIKIVIIRLLLVLSIGFLSVTAMNFPDTTIEVFGAMFILIGVNLLLYIPILKRSQTIDSINEITL